MFWTATFMTYQNITTSYFQFNINFLLQMHLHVPEDTYHLEL